MAITSVATQQRDQAETMDLIADRIGEACALTEMVSRVKVANDNDGEMFQHAARVTLRLLEEAQRAMKAAGLQGTA